MSFQNTWNNLKDFTPEEGIKVLFMCNETNCYEVSVYTDKGMLSAFTHWLPLPAAPVPDVTLELPVECIEYLIELLPDEAAYNAGEITHDLTLKRLEAVKTRG